MKLRFQINADFSIVLRLHHIQNVYIPIDISFFYSLIIISLFKKQNAFVVQNDLKSLIGPDF